MLTTGEVAQAARRGAASVRRWAATGELHGRRVGGRLLFKPGAVAALLGIEVGELQEMIDEAHAAAVAALAADVENATR
jgi:hypothetical protein